MSTSVYPKAKILKAYSNENLINISTLVNPKAKNLKAYSKENPRKNKHLRWESKEMRGGTFKHIQRKWEEKEEGEE